MALALKYQLLNMCFVTCSASVSEMLPGGQ